MKKLFIFSLVALFLGVAFPAVAAMPILIPNCATSESGNCSVCDFILMFINYANILGMVAGSTALVMLVIGGLYWIFSFGNQERVKQGKDILVHTFVGMFIILFAWIGVNFIIHALSGQELQNTRIFSREWWNPKCSTDYPTNCNEKDDAGEALHYSGDAVMDANHVCYRAGGGPCGVVGDCSPILQCEYIGLTTGWDCACCAGSDCSGEWGKELYGDVIANWASPYKQMTGDFCEVDADQTCCCEKDD